MWVSAGGGLGLCLGRTRPSPQGRSSAPLRALPSGLLRGLQCRPPKPREFHTSWMTASACTPPLRRVCSSRTSSSAPFSLGSLPPSARTAPVATDLQCSAHAQADARAHQGVRPHTAPAPLRVRQAVAAGHCGRHQPLPYRYVCRLFAAADVQRARRDRRGSQSRAQRERLLHGDRVVRARVLTRSTQAHAAPVSA